MKKDQLQLRQKGAAAIIGGKSPDITNKNDDRYV